MKKQKQESNVKNNLMVLLQLVIITVIIIFSFPREGQKHFGLWIFLVYLGCVAIVVIFFNFKFGREKNEKHTT